MKSSLKTRLFIGFAMALMMVLLGGIFSYKTFNKHRKEAEYVEKIYEVMTLVQRINRYVYEMESERRYLDAVHNGIADIYTAERKLLIRRNAINDEAVSGAITVLIVNTAFILILCVVLMIMIFREFSRRIKAQQELHNKLNEVVTMNNSAALKTRELEQSNKYKSEFLANMSHELRTPLNSVLILARLLEENKEHNLTAKQTEYAGIIHKSGLNLLKLINDILDLSKIEAGKAEMNIEPVSVKEIVNELEQLFRILAEEKGINFYIKIADSVPANIQTDKLRLEQVIRNLLSNAFKFTPKDGAVGMQWTLEPDGLHIAVSDTGTGIPASQQQLIFEAFRQADGSMSRKYGGTGLGLSISKELMKLLGGEIRLTSRKGQGSTFTIVMPANAQWQPSAQVLPLTDADAFLPGIPANFSETVQTLEDDRDQLQQQDQLILIIEDDHSFASVLRDLARKKGYKTIVTLNGNDGLYMARKYLPVAILLDMHLPLIDGNSILNILRDNEDLQHILVHVISAGEISPQVRAKVQGYTKKPLRLTDLESVFSGIGRQLQKQHRYVTDMAVVEEAAEVRLLDEPDFLLYQRKKNKVAVNGIVREKSLAGMKILLADDDMRNVFSLSALLAEHGLDVITAADGLEALDRLEEHPDTRIVLMDIMMPEMDGYEAMRKIRADSRFLRLPVIALTAKAMTGDREKCIAAGASDYIAKPVDSSHLLSLIRAWTV